MWKKWRHNPGRVLLPDLSIERGAQMEKCGRGQFRILVCQKGPVNSAAIDSCKESANYIATSWNDCNCLSLSLFFSLSLSLSVSLYPWLSDIHAIVHPFFFPLYFYPVISHGWSLFLIVSISLPFAHIFSMDLCGIRTNDGAHCSTPYFLPRFSVWSPSPRL